MYIENPYSTKGAPSGYMPPPDVVELTEVVQRDYSFGHGILTRPWIELNQRSPIDDENRGQLMFNAFVDTSVEDPNEAWKWRGTRSMARNKAITMHANLTSKFLLAKFIAQNDDDDIDMEFSEVMDDLVEWMAEPDNSEYQSSFLQVVFGMLSNPVTYMGAEFNQVKQKIKERDIDGSINIKEIIDEELSGFQVPIYSTSQVMITNAYVRNIQKQRSVIKRRFVDKSELEQKYKDHPNWLYVKAGWKTVYNSKDALFYDYYDILHPHLVEEVTWMNRKDDSEVVFLGGIYMGDVASVDNNPMLHRDNRDAPKYNVIPFGYSRIGDHFFYYKSLMNVVGWDHMLYDAMTEITMNRSILELDAPYAVSGSDKVDGDMIFPKAIVAFEDPDTKLTPLLPPSNLAAGFNAISATERSMAAESVDPISLDNVPKSTKNQQAVIAAVQQNAQKLVDDVQKQLVASLSQFGQLMKDIAINHITAPEVEEILGGQLRLKYKSFVLHNKQVAGKTMHKKIVFDSSLLGAEMTDDEQQMESLKLLEETGWPNSKQALIRINPELFAKYKYLSQMDVEDLEAKNGKFWQPILTNLYGMLRQDPLADAEGLLRRLMRSYFGAEGDALVKKAPAAGALPPPPPGGPNNGSPLGSMGQNSALSTAMQVQH